MEYKDFDKLSLAAKMEAMRAGNTLVLNHEELPEFISSIAPYLETKSEHISIERIGTMSSVRVFSITVVPIMQLRSAE